MAVDGAGNVYIADAGTARVLEFSGGTVQKLAGGVVQMVAVPHQVQGVLPGIAPGQEKAEVRGGFREIRPHLVHALKKGWDRVL